MPGQVIPFMAAIARLGGRAAALDKARRTLGPFEALQRLLQDRQPPPSPDNPATVLPRGRTLLGNQEQVTPGVEFILRRQGMNRNRVFDPETGVLREMNDTEKFVRALKEQQQGPETEEQKLQRMNAERERQGLPPLRPDQPDLGLGQSPAGRAAQEATDQTNRQLEQAARPPSIEDVQEFRSNLGQDLVQQINTRAVDTSEIEPEQALIRKGVPLSNAFMEPNTGLVFQNFFSDIDARGHQAVGAILVVPTSGEVQLTVVARDRTNQVEAISIPFPSRSAALRALSEIDFSDGGLPRMLDINALQNKQLNAMDLIDPDDILDPDDLLALGRLNEDPE